MSDPFCPLAHSRNADGVRHGLVEHSRAVARLASEFAAAFGAGEPAYWLGLVHDAGKAGPAWQRRLLEVEDTKATVGVDHKAAGTRWLIQTLGFDAFALLVQGHHGGLDAAGELEELLRSPKLDPVEEAEAWRRFAAAVPEVREPRRPIWPPGITGALDSELLARMLFSALVDADHLDTARHFAKRPRSTVEPVPMAELRDRFEENRLRKLKARAKASSVDPLREEVYEACVRTAALPPGFFKLAAPTGLGKTISGGAFALHHAAAHGLRRVVVAVPFITVTEQNATEYRRLLGATGRQRLLLEHHSSVNLEGPGSRWQRLAAENWDAPFIVTTTVQLLQSLHARTPSAMRKLHRLAGSVIVLDEIQALPVHLLLPILKVLAQLVKHFGVSVLLSSATQPEFWELEPLRQVAPVDVLPDPSRLTRRLRRLRPMRYEWWTSPRPSLREVAVKVARESSGQVLTVVNTVDHARVVFEAVREAAPKGTVVRHLSTLMCAAHRKAVLDEVNGLLKADPPQRVMLVSTQLIEAGVDIDFPVVYRAMAPADSILQAAGRSNREGNRVQGGRVVVFAPQEQSAPPSYGTPTAETRRLFGKGKADPDDLPTLARYYRGYYGLLNSTAMGSDVLDAREAWNFPAVAELFRMIEDDGFPVIVPYTDSSEDVPGPVAAWVARLRRDPANGRTVLPRLQPYLVTLRRKLLDKPEVSSCLRPVIGDLYEWTGAYDPLTGLKIPSAEEKS
jgi:CRISPR-associated endonuclease/helicase Cas3